MKILLVSAAMGAALFASTANAQDVEYYGAVGIGNRSMTMENYRFNYDTDIKILNVKFGAKFHKYFGAETEIKTGINKEEINNSSQLETEKLTIKENPSAGAYVIGYLPINEKFELLGKIGYSNISLDLNYVYNNGTWSENTSDSGSNGGFSYGAGAQYFFNPKIGVRADYTITTINDVDVKSLEASLVYKF